MLKDVSEYWKYLRVRGLVHFVICSFDEMKDRVSLEQAENSSLSDEFSIIKNKVQKVKEVFNILERDLKLKKEDLLLDDYRDQITNIEEIIPSRQISKSGKNFRIGFNTDNQLQFDKYDTVADEGPNDKKNLDTEVVQEIKNNPLKKNLKLYLIRNGLVIEDLVHSNFIV